MERKSGSGAEYANEIKGQWSEWSEWSEIPG
jgi:hypothetical protein